MCNVIQARLKCALSFLDFGINWLDSNVIKKKNGKREIFCTFVKMMNLSNLKTDNKLEVYCLWEYWCEM